METLLTGFLLSLSLCLDIGIVNLAILDTGLRHGVRPALMLGLGSALGDLVYAALSAAGIAWLLRYNAVQWTVWLIGTVVMAGLAVRTGWAAWQAWRTPSKDAAGLPIRETSHGLLFRRGLLLALASPSAILWFAAVGGALIADATRGDPLRVSEFLLGFLLGGVVWAMFISQLAGHGGARLGPRLRQGCHIIAALLFAGFAWRVGVSGYERLIAG
jgi:L-lysine exporter family protein LysE/ArgO